jgi:histidinol dehydrogenase
MKTYRYPAKEEWKEIIERPLADPSDIEKKVRKIVQKVKEKGDKAVIKYTARFDEVELGNIQVSAEETREGIELVPEELKTAIKQAAANIETFHRFQLQQSEWVVTMPGIMCSRKMVAIEKVGLYVPGGSAPLFSTILMLGIPARIAGCKEVILCTPPGAGGEMHPAILFAADLVGIKKIYKVGGVQAIAAMAFGTETIPQVYKIFGPGNQYVTFAKQLVQEMGVAIDMPAGPSEICVLADESADAAFVASDLLSQAEHGADSQALLITTSESIFQGCLNEINELLKDLPRKEIAERSLENSFVVLVKSIEEGIKLVNEYAPEHLIIACEDCDQISEKIINAGSIFLGNYSPESVGDYASGTNHTLPTNGFARMYSGLSVDSFVKKITYQKLTREGLMNIASTVIAMAEAEGLEAHAQAVRIRLDKKA